MFKHFTSICTLCCISLLLCYCEGTDPLTSYYEPKNAREFEEKYILQASNTSSFYLDKESTFINNSVSYFNTSDSQSCYSFLNAINNSISIFDFASKKEIKKIMLQREGPDGVGKLEFPSAHLVVNLDSIYVYNIMEGQLYLVDQQGKVKNRIRLIDYVHDKYNGCPEPSTGSPMVKVNNDIYFPCNLNAYQKSYSGYHSVLKLNLLTNEIKYLFTLPEVYDKAFWGESFKYVVSLCYNPDENKMVLNYPVDPYLYTSTPTGEIQGKTFVGSKFFEGIPPMMKDVEYGVKKDPNAKDIRQKEYSLSTADYNRIIYDPFRKVYYRVAYLRPAVTEVRKNNTVPSLSIVILDNKLSKMGELFLDSKLYEPSMIFVSREGLNFARKDLYKLHEDSIQFDEYKLAKK
jgi:hypothetical protein